MASLTEHLRDGGATTTDRYGIPLIASFGDVGAEHAALTTGAGLVDLSGFRRVNLTGRDRVRYLHGMITHDVEHLEPGHGRYATLITANGRTLTDLWVFASPEHLGLVFPPVFADDALKHLDFYLIADKAEFEDVTAATAQLSLQGPGAEAVLRAAGLPIPTEALSFEVGEAAGAPVQVYRIDRGGRGGFDLVTRQDASQALWGALVTHGARPAGLDALNIARVEANLPWAGHELVEKVIPMEVGLTDTAISFKKGCYIGQEVLAKIKYRGKVNRLLVRFPAPEAAKEGDRLFFEGRDQGWITSVVASPTEGRLALGLLHRKACESEGPVTVGEGDGAPAVSVTVLGE